MTNEVNIQEPITQIFPDGGLSYRNSGTHTQQTLEVWFADVKVVVTGRPNLYLLVKTIRVLSTLARIKHKDDHGITGS